MFKLFLKGALWILLQFSWWTKCHRVAWARNFKGAHMFGYLCHTWFLFFKHLLICTRGLLSCRGVCTNSRYFSYTLLQLVILNIRFSLFMFYGCGWFWYITSCRLKNRLSRREWLIVARLPNLLARRMISYFLHFKEYLNPKRLTG